MIMIIEKSLTTPIVARMVLLHDLHTGVILFITYYGSVDLQTSYAMIYVIFICMRYTNKGSIELFKFAAPLAVDDCR